MTGGLVRGTEDFRAVLAAFKNKTYSPRNYNAQTILDSNPGWASKYDPVAFADSVRNLVATLFLTPPEHPDAEPNQYLPDPEPTELPAEELRNPMAGTVPPTEAAEASGAYLTSEKRLLAVPKHVIAWVDSSQNSNRRITIYVMMPPGFSKEHYKVKVLSGGSQLEIEYIWPEEMLNPQILMQGHNHYFPGHNKIVAFEDSVKQLRGSNSSNKVSSFCAIQLPFLVEEQFCSDGVPCATYMTTTQKQNRILAVELMGLRSNYKSNAVEKEFSDSPSQNETESEENMVTEDEASLCQQREAERQARQRQQLLNQEAARRDRQRQDEERRTREKKERKDNERKVQEKRERTLKMEEKRREIERLRSQKQQQDEEIRRRNEREAENEVHSRDRLRENEKRVGFVETQDDDPMDYDELDDDLDEEEKRERDLDDMEDAQAEEDAQNRFRQEQEDLEHERRKRNEGKRERQQQGTGPQQTNMEKLQQALRQQNSETSDAESQAAIRERVLRHRRVQVEAEEETLEAKEARKQEIQMRRAENQRKKDKLMKQQQGPTNPGVFASACAAKAALRNQRRDKELEQEARDKEIREKAERERQEKERREQEEREAQAYREQQEKEQQDRDKKEQLLREKLERQKQERLAQEREQLAEQQRQQEQERLAREQEQLAEQQRQQAQEKRAKDDRERLAREQSREQQQHQVEEEQHHIRDEDGKSDIADESVLLFSSEEEENGGLFGPGAWDDQNTSNQIVRVAATRNPASFDNNGILIPPLVIPTEAPRRGTLTEEEAKRRALFKPLADSNDLRESRLKSQGAARSTRRSQSAQRLRGNVDKPNIAEFH